MPKGPVEIPKLGAQSPDTHAHLDMLDDPAGALERACLAGVTYIVTVDDPTEDPRGTLDSVDTWIDECRARLEHWAVPHGEPPTIRVIVGVHPHNAKHWSDEVRATIVAETKDSRVAGIGEIGLDFHYDHSPREDQVAAFRAQLELAHELELPVAVHLREAHDEGEAILREIGVPAAGCVLHCFTGDAAMAERFVEFGCHISFAGPVTFAKSESLREAVAVVPLDRLLVETDCPFMAPEPLRGRVNEPSWAVFTTKRIAEVKELPTTQVALAALGNAKRVFGGE
ncbi:MAG: TatD family deoxyribonuclease [Coriobacteriaceae bacterium]|nr:TatD family deoxyribonuclease [Coriobacteriaceae bacterium]